MKTLALFWLTEEMMEMMRTLRSVQIMPRGFKLPFPQGQKIREDDASSILGPEECRKRFRDAGRSSVDIDPHAILDHVCCEYRAASFVQSCQFAAFSMLLAHLVKNYRPIKRSN